MEVAGTLDHPDMQKALALQLARNGYVTFTVEYRLSPEAPFPAGMEDLEEAAAWFIDHAAKFGANPASIAVSGCSAGGQLAALDRYQELGRPLSCGDQHRRHLHLRQP